MIDKIFTTADRIISGIAEFVGMVAGMLTYGVLSFVAALLPVILIFLLAELLFGRRSRS